MPNSYNPITKEEISSWGKIPTPDVNTALVFVGSGKPMITVNQGQKGLTRGDIVWGKYSLVYKVDLSNFLIVFNENLPCATDAYHFQSKVQFECSVRAPEKILSLENKNIESVLNKFIFDDTVRNISRKHEVEKNSEAEKEIIAYLKTKAEYSGFYLKNFALALTLDEEAGEYIRRKKRLKEEHDITLIQFAQETEIKSKRDKYERQEEKASLLDEMELQMLKQNLENQRTKFELEQLQKQESFQLELMRQRTEFYSGMLQAGQWQLLALQLAQRPEDIPLILESLNQQKQIEREHQINMLKILIDTDAVEGWQLSEIGKRALQDLVGFTEKTTPVLEEASGGDTSSNRINIQSRADSPPEDKVAFPDDEESNRITKDE